LNGKNNLENGRGKKNVRFVFGDVLKLPFKNATFNKLVCSEVLEHLPDDKKGLQEMHRILKKNGTLYITVPHWNYPFFWDPVNYILQRLFKTHVKTGFWSGVWNFHIRLYHVKELKKVVQEAGFKIERIECLTHYGLPFNHYVTNIGFRLRTSPSLSNSLRDSMSKFSPDNKKTWFMRIVDLINWADKRNNKKFNEKVSTVGIFLKARKV